MILSDVFERFAQDSPLSVMAQGVMENALNPQILDQLFEDVAEKQFTNKLLFSSVVDLMSVVVCRIRPSIHAAFQAQAETVGATIEAVYDKLDRTETGVSAALVHTIAARLAPVIDAMDGARPAGCPAIASGSSTAITSPAPSTGSRSCGPCAPPPCPATRWSCSTPG